MEEFKSIAYNLYVQIVNSIFGAIPENNWYTTHLDAIHGIVTVILTAIVLLLAIALVWAIVRFFASILDVRR